MPSSLNKGELTDLIVDRFFKEKMKKEDASSSKNVEDDSSSTMFKGEREKDPVGLHLILGK